MRDPGAAGAAPEESALVARLKAGDEDAFRTLVTAHGARMLNVARRYLRDEGHAQDAVQDAFMSAFRAIQSFKGDSRLSTWLHRIVVNAALMKLRSQQRKPEEPIADLLPKFLDDGHFADPPKEWHEGAEEALARAEVRELVRGEIQELPDSYRSVLMLRDIEELDTGETARLLEISPNAVKVRLHRARQALRERLNAHAGVLNP
jgi:RNA polymerase sigma-70 factor (ECF subfamily)